MKLKRDFQTRVGHFEYNAAEIEPNNMLDKHSPCNYAQNEPP